MAGIRNRKKSCCLFLLIVSHKNAIKMECYSLGAGSVCGSGREGAGEWGIMGMVGYISRIGGSALEKNCWNFFTFYLSKL